VSTTNTASSLAGFVSLALALTLWRSPGSSDKLCPAYIERNANADVAYLFRPPRRWGRPNIRQKI
jgi:hypothetical protein